MPKINAGSNATVALTAGQVISVSSGGGLLRFEYPAGTVLFEGDGVDQTFGPFPSSGNCVITSLMGGIDYVVSTPPGSVAPYAPSNADIRGRFSSIGTRIFGGRMERDIDNTSAFTWEVVTALSQEFDAVRVIFANSRNAAGTTASPVAVAYVAAVADSVEASTDAATWVNVTAAGSSSITLTAASAQYRRAFVVSDWIALSSIPRTDGGTLPLIAIRTWVNGGNPLTLLGSGGGTDSFANWATKPDGRIWRIRRRAGDFASTNRTTFTSGATAVNETPIIGVQYAARGKVVTVMTCGDSIYEGRGTYLGEGFVAPAAWGLSSTSELAYDYCNLSWTSRPFSTFEDSLNDAIAAGIVPDVLVFPTGSPNDIASTISAANISAFRLRMSRMLATCRTNNIQPILGSFMPSNTAVKAYGATDSLREAFAQEIEARTSRAIAAIPTASLMRGTQDGSGQYQMVPTYTTDGIHPNDTGNTALTVAAKAAILRATRWQ
jgi:hypothetical protein